MGRSERLIKPGDSWFSPKRIWVRPLGRMKTAGGRALDGLGALTGYQPQPNSECPWVVPQGDSVRAIMFVRERERAQTLG